MGENHEYTAPELIVYGTLAELTKAGASEAGHDGIYYHQFGYNGSVIRPIDRP